MEKISAVQEVDSQWSVIMDAYNEYQEQAREVLLRERLLAKASMATLVDIASDLGIEVTEDDTLETLAGKIKDHKATAGQEDNVIDLGKGEFVATKVEK